MKFKQTPLMTKAGVKIGASYAPATRDPMSREDVYWQGILLGVEPEFSQRRVAGWVGYGLILAVIFAVLVVS